NEVEVLKTADLMREVVLAENAYLSFYKIGTVHNVPVLTTPYQIELISDVDSIGTGISLNILEISNDILELSNRDTVFQVKRNIPFSIPDIGTIDISKVSESTSFIGNSYGFSIVPIRNAVSGLMGAFSADVANKLVSAIDLALESVLPREGDQLLNTLIGKYVELHLREKNVIADSALGF